MRYILCLAGDEHPDLIEAADPCCNNIYKSFTSRKDLYTPYEGPREYLDYSTLNGGDIVLFGKPTTKSNVYQWSHIGIACNSSGDMLHSSRFKPGSGDLIICENDQNVVYPDMIGGINQMRIDTYQSPIWEKDNDFIAVFRYLDSEDETTLSVRVESHKLKYPFKTAHGTKTSIQTICTSLSHPEYQDGLGEASLYYGESIASSLHQIESVRAKVCDSLSTNELQKLLPPSAARNAIDCAIHDFLAKQKSILLPNLLGLKTKEQYLTCMTIGIDSNEQIRIKVREVATNYPILKIKCDGSNEGDDLKRLEIIRQEAPEAEIWIDANEGWKSLAHYRQLIPKLERLGVSMIEQPFKRENDHWISELSLTERPISLCADESCQTSKDISKLKDVGYDAINIKLAKTGGLTEALNTLNMAKEHGLNVMLGNQNGTTLGMEPLLALAGDNAVKYLDLDGPLLLIPEDGMRDNRIIEYNRALISWSVAL